MNETLNHLWAEGTDYFEYTSAANPRMPRIAVEVFPASLHQIDQTKVIPLDLAGAMQSPYPCTGPSLLASFIHINPGESLATESDCASQVFFCIRGKGRSEMADGTLTWKTGDYFAVPGSRKLTHHADEDTAFYWVTDAPLLSYLGATAHADRFRPLYFSHERLEEELARVRAENEGKDKNRNGILLANRDCPVTKTVTHTLWSLYNLLPRHSRQKAHRHNSIAVERSTRTETSSTRSKPRGCQVPCLSPLRVGGIRTTMNPTRTPSFCRFKTRPCTRRFRRSTSSFQRAAEPLMNRRSVRGRHVLRFGALHSAAVYGLPASWIFAISAAGRAALKRMNSSMLPLRLRTANSGSLR